MRGVIISACAAVACAMAVGCGGRNTNTTSTNEDVPPLPIIRLGESKRIGDLVIAPEAVEFKKVVAWEDTSVPHRPAESEVGPYLAITILVSNATEGRVIEPFPYGVGSGGIDNFGNKIEWAGLDEKPTELRPGEQNEITLYFKRKIETAKEYSIDIWIETDGPKSRWTMKFNAADIRRSP